MRLEKSKRTIGKLSAAAAGWCAHVQWDMLVEEGEPRRESRSASGAGRCWEPALAPTYRAPPPGQGEARLLQGTGCTAPGPGLQQERTRSSLRVFIVGSITTSFTATICSSMARSCTSLNSCKTRAGGGR